MRAPLLDAQTNLQVMEVDAPALIKSCCRVDNWPLFSIHKLIVCKELAVFYYLPRLHGPCSFFNLWFVLRSATSSNIFTRQELQCFLEGDVIWLHILNISEHESIILKLTMVSLTLIIT